VPFDAVGTTLLGTGSCFQRFVMEKADILTTGD